MKFLASYLIAFVIAGVPGVAFAGCELDIVPPTSPAVTHDPFSPVRTQMGFQVSVTNRGDIGCDGELFLLPPGGQFRLRNGNSSLDYVLRSPGGLTASPEVGPVRVSLVAGETRTIEFDAEIDQQLSSPGLYSGEVGLRLDQAGQVADTATITMNANIPARALMTITGTRSARRDARDAAPALIDFGTLQNGSQQTVFVNVWSNSTVNVTLQSENNGALELEGRRGLPNIPYTVNFAGDDVLLAGPVSLRRDPAMRIDGEAYPMTLTVPSIEGRYAGVYRDVITVSIDTN